MEKETEPAASNKSRETGRDILIFLLGPLAFILLVKFTGYQIFYKGKPDDRDKKRVTFLLSFGTLFYLLVTLLISTILA
jgi:hypothetical protein